MSTISLGHIVKRKHEQLLANNVGNETVIMDLQSGNYISLNATGSVIWKHIEQPVTVDNLVDTLLKQYAVSREHCSKDVLEYLNQMQEQGIIAVEAQ